MILIENLETPEMFRDWTEEIILVTHGDYDQKRDSTFNNYTSF